MVNIEIKDPQKALDVLGHLDPDSSADSDECYAWISELQWTIQEAMQKEEEL